MLIVALIVYQYRGKRVILDIRSLATTMPVAAIVVAICAAAAAVSAIAVDMHLLASHFTPLHLGLLYLPELVATAVTAAVFGMVFNRRSLHYLPLLGMACLCAGTAVMALFGPSASVALAGSGLVGLGVGATVVPAFFVVGLSVTSRGLGQVFAIVELLRAVAAFMVAPILLYVATSVAAGTTIALWATFGLAAGGAIVAIGLYVLGGARPVAPAFETWFGGKEPGWSSPPLLARLRRRSPEPNRRVGIEGPGPNEPQAVSVIRGARRRRARARTERRRDCEPTPSRRPRRRLRKRGSDEGAMRERRIWPACRGGRSRLAAARGADRCERS